MNLHDEDARNDARGRQLAERIGLGVNKRPSSLHLPNPEWLEADRLGRLLLEHFDAQDAARRGTTTDGGDEDGI